MNNMAPDPFSPLEPHKITATAATPPASDWVPVLPVPDGIPVSFPSHRLGQPSAHCVYRNAQDKMLFVVCRFDLPDGGKQFFPLTFCKHANGRQKWRWKGLPAPRPLYGLDRLAIRPDAPVLVCEGEKAADAATALFPDHVAITSPNGAKSAANADWSAVTGRVVTIWPDNDNEGRAYAEDVARRVIAAGAVSVAVVQVPNGFPAKWDLADAQPEGVPGADLQRLLIEAEPMKTATAATPPKPSAMYRLHMKLNGPNAGLWFVPDDPEKNSMRVSGPFEIPAQTRDKNSGAWGIELIWYDDDKHRHEWVMPRDLLAGDGAEVRRELLAGGLYIAPSQSAHNKLIEYLLNAKPEARARCVDAVGWHGGVYVTLGKVYGETEGERVLLQTAGRVDDFDCKGSLEGWQNDVAAYAVGNSRLAFSISTAFVGPLLRLVNENSHGFHLPGASSVGKTLAALVAASVWGGPIHSWRATDNAGENLASGANDGFLVMDELSQANGNAADAMAYMLGNGQGKSRMHRNATAKPITTWRLVFLSTGEVGLAEKLAEVGRKAKAGQSVRLIEIPADAGAGHGLFETLHGFTGGDALARHLHAATERHQGHAIRQFLECVTKDPVALADRLKAAMADWQGRHVQKKVDGQVSRVAARFALVAAAGELAAAIGIVPWLDGEADRAAAVCFKAWLDRRGGVGSAEARAGVAQVQTFIESHGASRFVPIWESGEDPSKFINRAGYRRKNSADEWEYYVFPHAWKDEICKGLDAAAVAKELSARGLLLRGTDDKSSKLVKIPGDDPARFYHLAAHILTGGDDHA